MSTMSTMYATFLACSVFPNLIIAAPPRESGPVLSFEPTIHYNLNTNSTKPTSAPNLRPTVATTSTSSTISLSTAEIASIAVIGSALVFFILYFCLVHRPRMREEKPPYEGVQTPTKRTLAVKTKMALKALSPSKPLSPSAKLSFIDAVNSTQKPVQAVQTTKVESFSKRGVLRDSMNV